VRPETLVTPLGQRWVVRRERRTSMSRLLGVVVFGLVATLGCQKPEKTDANAKPDPVVATSAPATAAEPALTAGEEPGCCKPTTGQPPCGEAEKAACDCEKEGKDCPHHAAPPNSGAEGQNGCPHMDSKDPNAPCPCKAEGHKCPHAGG